MWASIGAVAALGLVLWAVIALAKNSGRNAARLEALKQEAAYKAGRSFSQYPQSAHNWLPSHAVDLAPYPIDWDNLARFKEMWLRFDAIARVLKERGEIMSEFMWGGDFKRLKDSPHIEIK